MSFLTRELSRMLGLPYTAYWFKYGSAAASYYAYTDAGQTVTAPGSLANEAVTYNPIPIIRENVVSTGSLDKQQLIISVPRDTPMVDLFIAYPPAQVVQAVIREGHLGETDQVPVQWAGRVVALTLEGSTAKFMCEPIITSLRRNGLRRNWMIGCPHQLYGTSCRADKSYATVNVTTAVVNTNVSTLVVPTSWNSAFALAKFIGGVIQWTDALGNVIIRTILNAGATSIVLGGRAVTIPSGTVLAVSLGCDHRQDDCLGLHKETTTGFANIGNYGGQDWIPIKNPVNKDMIYFG